MVIPFTPPTLRTAASLLAAPVLFMPLLVADVEDCRTSALATSGFISINRASAAELEALWLLPDWPTVAFHGSTCRRPKGVVPVSTALPALVPTPTWLPPTTVVLPIFSASAPAAPLVG